MYVCTYTGCNCIALVVHDKYDMISQVQTDRDDSFPSCMTREIWTFICAFVHRKNVNFYFFFLSKDMILMCDR